MTSIRPVRIGDRLLGPGQPCYVIAEAGSNHNGSYEQALALIDVAAEAGCDAVKFQVFRANLLYAEGAGQSDYLGDSRSINDIIRAMELPHDWIPKLHAYSVAKGLHFLASAFDEAAVDLIEPWVDAFKCASYEMTHTPLLQYMASKGKPVLLSTGAATLDEVGEAVGAVRAVAPELPLVLLQCTASYPAPLAAAHVRTIPAMREAFGVLTGLSDHTKDAITAPMTAVALGAVVIEKHYTLSQRLPGPDHRFALEPHELKDLVRRVREVEAALGRAEKLPDPVEGELRHFARRSVFTTRPVRHGEAFTRDNTAVLRRGKLPAGLDPQHFQAVLTHTAARDLEAFTPLQAQDVADAPEIHPASVTLQRATAQDARAVWEWNNDPAVRAVSLVQEAIPWEDHQRWFAGKLADPHARLWIVRHDGQPAGVVRVDRRGDEGVVSIALAGSARGKGLGPLALREAARRYFGETGDRHLKAYILPDNLPSVRAFAAAGFVQDGQAELGGRTLGVHVLRA